MNGSPSSRDLATELYRLIKLEISQYFTVEEVEYIIRRSNNDLKESAKLIRAMYKSRRHNRPNNVSDDRFFLSQLERIQQVDEELGPSP